MIQFLKSFLFIIATFIMIATLFLIPSSSGPVSITYIATLSVYLGLDIAGMIAKTVSLPKGEFKQLNIHKYIIASVCLVVLIIASIYVNNFQKIETAITSYVSASLIIITCLIGGLEGNKIATRYSINNQDEDLK